VWETSIRLEESTKLEFKFTRGSWTTRPATEQRRGPWSALHGDDDREDPRPYDDRILVLLMSDGFPEMFNAAGETFVVLKVK
jgi:hypothetical protein